MTYRTPENLIRGIMANSVRQIAEQHAPALKIPEVDRVSVALGVLHANGVESAAKKDDNTITISNKEMLQAAQIMDTAIMKGLMSAKPQFVSAEAIDTPEHKPEPVAVGPEPTPPENGHKIGEELDDITQEAIEGDQLDEVSKSLLGRYNNKVMDRQDHHAQHILNLGNGNRKLSGAKQKRLNDHVKAYRKNDKGQEMAIRKVGDHVDGKPAKVMAKEEVELNELSYGKLKAYTKAGHEAVAKTDKMDDRVRRRKEGLERVKRLKVKKVSKAAFEETSPAIMIQRVLAEAKGERLLAVHHSECGKHCAKIYKNTELSEFRNQYHVNGKHHEPADSFHYDKEDAHGTAQHELKRMTKLNGALKEATEEEINALVEEFEQIDELSKATLKSYVDKSSKSLAHHARSETRANNAYAARSDKGDYEKASDHAASEDTHRRKFANRAVGIKQASRRLADGGKNNIRTSYRGRNVSEAAEEGQLPFKHVGTYADADGRMLYLHQNISNSSHLLMDPDGELVLTTWETGTSNDVHNELISGERRMTGNLHESVQLDELSKNTLVNYMNKASREASHAENVGHYKQASKRAAGAEKAYNKAKTMREETLIEGKKEDLEKAKKHLFKHPAANDIGRTIHGAAKHYNYVQDAVDHVFNNHSKELDYEDFDKMRPHLEDSFKRSGLK